MDAPKKPVKKDNDKPKGDEKDNKTHAQPKPVKKDSDKQKVIKRITNRMNKQNLLRRTVTKVIKVIKRMIKRMHKQNLLRRTVRNQKVIKRMIK